MRIPGSGTGKTLVLRERLFQFAERELLVMA
jgi:hypothetical protein